MRGFLDFIETVIEFIVAFMTRYYKDMMFTFTSCAFAFSFSFFLLFIADIVAPSLLIHSTISFDAPTNLDMTLVERDENRHYKNYYDYFKEPLDPPFLENKHRTNLMLLASNYHANYNKIRLDDGNDNPYLTLSNQQKLFEFSFKVIEDWSYDLKLIRYFKRELRLSEDFIVKIMNREIPAYAQHRLYSGGLHWKTVEKKPDFSHLLTGALFLALGITLSVVLYNFCYYHRPY